MKNPAAVALGRLGGVVGGKARAAALSPAERKRIASEAAKARWERVRLYQGHDPRACDFFEGIDGFCGYCWRAFRKLPDGTVEFVLPSGEWGKFACDRDDSWLE